MHPLDHNRRAWDARARQRQPHTQTVRPDQLQRPMVHLDPEQWLGSDLAGQRVLCLAGGGGLQSALCAAARAEVTVVDISPEMIALDRKIADQYHFKIQTLVRSMDQLDSLPASSFDLILQPVSTCYLPALDKLFSETARVAKPGALYISQHKQPVNLQASALPMPQSYALIEPYCSAQPLPPIPPAFEHRESGTHEYLHRWETLLGGLCRAGFVIEDLVEPRHADPNAPAGTFPHRCVFVPPYVKIRARRTAKPSLLLHLPR